MENHYLEANHTLWNEWTLLNLDEASDYRTQLVQFEQGETTLSEIVINEVGDVSGKSLLHLMCHIGLDTLSWAREGALVTGVDFSEESIIAAKTLSKQISNSAVFICSDVYQLAEILHQQFDIVFTSSGILPWLPDLNGWAKVIALMLKPGGVFYLHEWHPFRRLILPRRVDADGKPNGLGYFGQSTPVCFSEQGSYANPTANSVHIAHYWAHGLGEIVTSLCENGLQIEYLHEFPKVVETAQVLVCQTDGRYEAHPVQDLLIPHSFSIRAIKRANRDF